MTRGDQRVGHAVGDLPQVGRGDGVAAVPGKTGAPGVMLSRRIEADDLAVLDHLQAAADMHRGGRDHLAVLDQTELGGAAADVDVENALCLVAGHPRGARAVGREHRLHVMAGGRRDEFAALLGEDRGDAFGVLAPQRLAGQNDHAGIDLVGIEPGGVVGVVDDGAELGVVDALLAPIGRQRDRRLEQCLARDDVVAAGQILGQAAQVDARKYDLRARGADIDADRHQRDVVLLPQRIVLQRPVVGVEIVVVIVIGIVGVRVHGVAAVKMVGERMGRLLFFVFFVVGHSRSPGADCNPPPANEGQWRPYFSRGGADRAWWDIRATFRAAAPRSIRRYGRDPGSGRAGALPPRRS